MKYSNTILYKACSILKSLATPVVSELPFFILFLFAIAIQMEVPFLKRVIQGHEMEALVYLYHYLPRAMALTYLFTLLVYYTKSKAVKISCYTLTATLMFVCMFLRWVFKRPLMPDIFVLLAETNSKESSEFLSSFLLTRGSIISIGCLAVYVVVAFFLEKQRTKIALWWVRQKWQQVINGVLCVFVCIGLVQFNLYVRVLTAQDNDKINIICNGDDDLSRLDTLSAIYTSIFYLYFMHEDMENAVRVTLNAQVAAQDFATDSLNVVYVIGESYNKWHAHLYGYPLPTTPHLDDELKKGNLFVFEDVVAPFNSTSMVMKNTLCCNSLRYGEKWSDKPYFPTLFKKAGYSVVSWDNQKGESKTNAALYALSLDAFMYDEELSKASYSQVSQRRYPYDRELVDDFSRNAKLGSVRQLVMFHLYGQHVDFKSRYPHTKYFSRFSAKDFKRTESYMDDTKRGMIADYDNATFYNDHILGKIIDLFRNENTVLVYFSDHGEEVYDYRDSFGRVKFEPEEQPQGLHCQYDVPFMIWCSDKYKECHPEVVDDIRRSLRKPFRTDEICQVLFHLADLKTAYYRPECDLLSNSYIKYRRTVGDGIRYDK